MNLEKYKEDGKIILLDKPSGISSFRFINKYKKDIGAKKIGHAGTLDPMASGAMLVAINENTKILNKFVGLDKKYIAEICLGIKTDTGDRDGKIIEEKAFFKINEEKVKEIIKSLIGNIELPVSNFSSMKYLGNPRYKYARANIKIPEARRIMEIKNAKLLKLKDNKITVLFDVGSGSYIRSIAEFLGEKLETVAHLSELRRISIGHFVLK